MIRSVALALAFIGLSSIAQAAGLAGNWSGTWTKNGDSLPVTVTFAQEKGAYAGSFDSDALQVAGIPFKDVRMSGTSVHWLLQGDSSADIFDGSLRGDVLSGSFAEGATKGFFVLRRNPKPPHALDEGDVEFAAGKVTIAGTLIQPADSKYPCPAIVFLHGSGAEGRWANRWLAERLARAGFAALITDQRGVGGSTGDWQQASFADLASDAVAAIRFLQDQREIDPKRIGIYGHSQGGTLAPLVAAKAHDLAFVIASAAGGIDPAEIEEYSIGNSIGIPTLPPAEAKGAKAFVHAIVDVAYRGHPRSELDALAAKFKKRSWYFDPPPPDNYYWTFSRRVENAHPQSYWRQVKRPVLLLYGARDERVPPARDAIAILTALSAGGNKRATLHIFSEADHLFSLPSANGGWPKRVPDCADVLIAWAKEVSRK